MFEAFVPYFSFQKPFHLFKSFYLKLILFVILLLLIFTTYFLSLSLSVSGAHLNGRTMCGGFDFLLKSGVRGEGPTLAQKQQRS